MLIDHKLLSAEALHNIISEFVMRENDDLPVSIKIEQVKNSLDRKTAVIYFDEETEECNIIAKNQI